MHASTGYSICDFSRLLGSTSRTVKIEKKTEGKIDGDKDNVHSAHLQ